MAEKKNDAEVNNIDAQTENTRVNTARTLSLTPEEIRTHQWNRQPHAVREFGGSALAVSEILDEMGSRSRKWFKEPHSEKAKKYHELKQRENKN